MIQRPKTLEALLEALRKLPSVGPKMSERMAFFLLRQTAQEFGAFLSVIETAYEQVRPCPDCGYWDEISPCRICQDPARDRSSICVIETSQDLIAMSRVKDYNGLYHVLGGALSPLEGVGPQDLEIQSFLRRLESGTVKEIVLALNADMEGETTCAFIAEQVAALLNRLGWPQDFICVTRLAQGLPSGGELEYMDEMTLRRAFSGRQSLAVSKKELEPSLSISETIHSN